MADTGVDVRLGADVSGAKSSMEDAQRSIAASLQGIQKALDDFSSKNKQATEQAIKNNADLSRTFLELKASATGGFNGIVGVIERFKGVWASLATVLAGGLLWKESVEAMVDMQHQVEKLEIVFGMMSDKATTTAIAMKILGKSGDDLAAMGMKVARQLKMNEAGLNDLGVATRGANGQLLPLDTIMQNGFKTMQTYRAGVDQDEFALAMYGRTVGDVVDVMLRLPAAQQRALELQRELGIEMGPAKQEEIKAYQLEVGAFKTSLSLIATEIGIAVLPRLEALAKYFNEVGPAAAKVFVNSLSSILATLDYVATGAEKFQRRWQANNETKLADERFFNSAWKALTTGGWDAVQKLWEERSLELKKIELKKNADILGMEADFLKRMGMLSDVTKPPGAPGPGPLGSGAKQFPMKPPAGAATQLELWKLQLDEMRDAEDAFHKLSHAQEAAFWESKLALVKKGTKDYVEVYHLMVEAKKGAALDEYAIVVAGFSEQIAAAKNNRDQQMALEADRVAYVKSKYGEESVQFKAAMKEMEAARQHWADVDMQVVAIQTKQAAARADFESKMELLDGQQKVALRQITNAQLFALESDLENKTYAAKKAGLDHEIALEAAGPNSVTKIAELNAQKEALEEKHQEALTTIDNKAVLDRLQYQLQADQAVENSFATLVDDLVTGTKTWKQAFTDAIKSITAELNKLAAQQFAKQIFGGGTAGGGMVDSLMASIFGGKGGGFDIGSILSGFGIPLFATGTAYVPQDTLAMVHKGEAIIPAQYNQRGALGQSFSVANHFNISGPVDSRTQDQIAAAAARGVQRAMQRNL